MQTWMVHHPSVPGRNVEVNLPDIWDNAPADIIIVAITMVIISRKNKGPLDLTARRSEGVGEEFFNSY
ncbi:MAG: hypothetical protein QXW80_06700 [Candidatus Micrarchaeia archaeon]